MIARGSWRSVGRGRGDGGKGRGWRDVNGCEGGWEGCEVSWLGLSALAFVSLQ